MGAVPLPLTAAGSPAAGQTLSGGTGGALVRRTVLPGGVRVLTEAMPGQSSVTFGLWVGGRFPAKELPAYIVAQVLGGIIAATLLYFIASGKPGFDLAASGLAANGYGDHSPGGYSMISGLVCEVVMTAMFILIIMGATDKRVPAGFAPIAIGLALTLIHLIAIPVTNTSVNPARSTGPALIVGGWALQQLWMFWLAPLVGATLGALTYRWLGKQDD